jgi:hypothetical protein
VIVSSRGCPLVTVVNGPLMARRSWPVRRRRGRPSPGCARQATLKFYEGRDILVPGPDTPTGRPGAALQHPAVGWLGLSPPQCLPVDEPLDDADRLCGSASCPVRVVNSGLAARLREGNHCAALILPLPAMLPGVAVLLVQ